MLQHYYSGKKTVRANAGTPHSKPFTFSHCQMTKKSWKNRETIYQNSINVVQT
jgi:hypothetical protein